MKFTLSFRIWHWLNAIIVLGLLGTVFLRKTFLNWRDNSEILIQELSQMGIEISIEQATILARAVRAGMWEWHIYLGYVLVGLVLYRIYIYFNNKEPSKEFKSLTLHKKIVNISYYILYLVVFFMSISGLVIHFHDLIGISKEIAHDIKDVHEFVYNYVLIFVVFHFLGVVIADNTNEKGIISSMINGKELLK